MQTAGQLNLPYGLGTELLIRSDARSKVLKDSTEDKRAYDGKHNGICETGRFKLVVKK